MKKHAQLTLFFVIAVLIIGVGLVFVHYNRITARYPEYTQNIVESKKQCLADLLENAVIEIGKSSGYFAIPKNISITYLNETVALYYINSTITIPKIQNIDKALLEYVRTHDRCSGVSNMDNTLFNTKVDCYEVKSTENFTLLGCKVHITKYLYRSINLVEVYTHLTLYRLLNATIEIVDNYAQSPGYVCIDCINGIATRHKVNVSIVPITREVNATTDTAWLFVRPINQTMPVLRFALELTHFVGITSNSSLLSNNSR